MPSWFRRVLPGVATVFVTALMVGTLSAQGVTTGAASGLVTDQAGRPLSGATVEFTHEPTGFRTTAVTNVRGVFTVQGLEPGGPYTVRIRQIGYRPVVQERIFIALGQTFRLNASLDAVVIELEDILVVADPMVAEFAPTRQGTRTTITGEQLADLPTLDRRFIDFARLTPQIVNRDENQGLGVSAIGQNNRFNTIQIDGSTVNDRFGLGSTGTSGGQARGKPIGFEAVKEYQVELAPYDVRQGNFTGALINAITKNGTNRLQASAFGYFRNEGLAGSPLGDTEFETWQFGATLGGPIKKNKAHFFLDAEFQRASTPAPGPATGGAGVVPDQADVDAFNAALVSKGLTPGSAGLFTQDNPLTNLTARADWLLSTNNRLVFRYSYNEAADDVFNQWDSRGGAFRLDNNAYRFNNETHNPSLQLFSNFTNGSSNEFRLSYNRIRDNRDPAVIEPQITVGGFTDSAGDGYALRAGAESFSMGNALDQDIWELTDNFTLKPIGDHRITIGTRNEFYKVNNLFAQQSFGVWQYDDLASFVTGQAGDANQYDVGGDLGGGIPAVFNSAIIGLYVQDQWQITPKFNLTYGLRVDIPIFPDQPTYAAQAIADFDDPQVPSSQALWNPRAGFNWDIDGLGNQQLRGGAGIFTGTPAYVWMSNAYANNGTGLGLLECDNAPNTVTPAFNASATSPTLVCDGPGGAGTGTGVGDGTFLGEVDIIAGNTKFPQVFRGNLAYDRRLPENFILTLEGIFSSGVNDYFIVNRNLSAPCSTTGGVCGNSQPANDVGDGIVGSDQNGRIMYGGIDPTNGQERLCVAAQAVRPQFQHDRLLHLRAIQGRTKLRLESRYFQLASRAGEFRRSVFSGCHYIQLRPAQQSGDLRDLRFPVGSVVDPVLVDLHRPIGAAVHLRGWCPAGRIEQGGGSQC